MSDSAALKVESADGIVVVYLSGEIDVSNTERLETDIRGAVVDADSIVIDLDAVDFLDSSGLRLLKRLSVGAAEATANFVVVAPPKSVARSVIELVSMSDEMTVQDSRHGPN